jgi:hypothetical protein
MKRTRHKRSPSARRRALEVIAAHPEGCTEAVLASENVPADVLIELVQSGLVIARNERLEDEDGAERLRGCGLRKRETLKGLHFKCLGRGGIFAAAPAGQPISKPIGAPPAVARHPSCVERRRRHGEQAGCDQAGCGT